MDEGFSRERIRLIRDLAEKADIFTKHGDLIATACGLVCEPWLLSTSIIISRLSKQLRSGYEAARYTDPVSLLRAAFRTPEEELVTLVHLESHWPCFALRAFQ